MRPFKCRCWGITLLVTSTLIGFGAAFTQCKDPVSNEEVPVASLCEKYALPDNDVFAVGTTTDSVCELFDYYRGGPKTDRTCIPHGGIRDTTIAIVCKLASCAAYPNYNCSGEATISGLLPVRVPFPGGVPLPLINYWGPLVGYTATCLPGIDLSP